MSTAYLTLALLAVFANGGSFIAALVHFKPIVPARLSAACPNPG
ncbi:MAG TPA: hypothetical protein VKV73_16945 [Chloroflexota bacterium]|nr:hypothetical protein [Chloroflexota bacterium]